MRDFACIMLKVNGFSVKGVIMSYSYATGSKKNFFKKLENYSNLVRGLRSSDVIT